MQYKVFLEQKGFPDNFKNVEITLPKGINNKVTFIESSFLTSLNSYNAKLNIKSIDYVSLEDIFPNFESCQYAGAIVEEHSITEQQISRYKNDFVIKNKDNNIYAYKILCYLFFAQSAVDSRNIFISQCIFPAIINYLEKFIDSPSYTIADHPIYIVNIANEKHTANTLLKRIASLISSGFGYIDIWRNESIDGNIIPKDLTSFIQTYEKSYQQGTNLFSTNCYSIDFLNKKVIIEVKKLVVGEYLTNKNGKYGFVGSYEKFYWMDLLPIIIIAVNSGFEIDTSKLEQFIKNTETNFGNNKKFRRFKMLLCYINKINVYGCK